MGTALRDKDPDLIHLLTMRTLRAQYLLRPSKDVNKILAGILARYQEFFKIEIFAYIFLSNHKHLLARAPLGNMDEFMENVNREISRRLNFELERAGKFWHRRYKDQAVVTDKDIEEAFLYIMTNAVKHGAATHPSQWIGLNSYEQTLTEKPRTCSFHHYSANNPDEETTWHDLNLTPLPALAVLSKDERTAYLSAKIEARTNEIVEFRRSQGEGFISSEQARNIDPFSSPRSSSTSPTGNCYSKDPEVIRAFKAIEAARRFSYDLASMRYRLGDLTVEFPCFTFKPPLHRKPRICPFTPLPDDYFQKVA